MPTFEQLLTARLGPLDTAVTQWTEMIGKLTSPLQTDASAMKTKADKSSWKGENATVTKEFVTKTAKEFGDAITEAESVRDLLKDAHTLFKAAQDDLKHTYENPPPGIIIYPDGVLSHRIHPDRRAKDSTEPLATEAQFEQLRGKIDGILKRANEADELCAWGLRALIKHHPNDFGSTDLSGVADARKMRAEEQQQAENGREAAKLYARWEHLDDGERERLLTLAEEGKDSPAFAEQLMTKLSYRGREQQEAVLLLASSLESGGADGQLSSTDARLYKALSGSLATATGPDSSIGSPGGVTSAWTDKLIATARDGNGLPRQHPGAIGGGAATLKNLTDLMAADAGDDDVYDPNKDPKEKSSPWKKDEGDPVYSEAFLTEVGDTIREWETGNDDAYDGVMKNWQGTQEDPMKGLLNAMSRNPAASTHYFDPSTTDNLKYFLEDREWPGGEVESKMPDETQYTSARAELGLALESAATGRAPGSPMHPVPVHHDAAETAIFERVMGEYTEALHKDQSAVPVPMRLPMADMIADYGSDVHQILGKKMDGPTDFNQLEIDRGDLTRIIRATAEDPNAYKMIHGSQTVVISEGLDDFPADSFRKEDPELRAWVKQSASVLGHLDGVRGDVIYDLGQAEKDANAYKRVLNYHVVGGLLTPIPVVGDAIQRSVDFGMNGHLNNADADVDAETRNNMIKHYDYGQKQMNGMLRGMALERGLSDQELDASPGEYEDHLQSITEQWYGNGMGDADKSMGQ
ncbi:MULTISPECIES: DUF6571 family protein [Streptomyces]|uniref:DUF6571 domain-containing protein n=3 Tax=Streptomyces TaxID=1883 RepID=A0A652L8G5_9ACTN|nr:MULTISPECIES: DUF6571 family protein [unclassified Streptomyces]MDX3328485.1 hypothetical protein [Streptomyces sp. ME02-6979-3A]MDX3430402.1 hypothetical protein [Streptomyces sp. ME01-18a]MDX3686333.1 hypothetical protein [Streptomyces sp. AK04-4c]TXS32383.1 hypothetical protein EAO74_06895 [Streptomyces sp. gb1(2016)]